MTHADKLRFLADRIEDEKEFYIGRLLYKYHKLELTEPWDSTKKDSKFMKSHLLLDSILWLDLKQKPQWEFTEDEKVILRNLHDDYQWVARDVHVNGLFAYTLKPTAYKQFWSCGIGHMTSLEGFKHLFQSIQGTDDEPCEFRKYLEGNE